MRRTSDTLFPFSTLDLFIETPEVKSTSFHCVDMKATQDHESAALIGLYYLEGKRPLSGEGQVKDKLTPALVSSVRLLAVEH